MGKILKTIGALSALAVVGTGTAFAIPQSREYLADKIAEFASPKYAEVLDLNKTQQTTIEDLQKKQAELSTQLTSLQSDYNNLNAKLSSVQSSLDDALNEKASIESELINTKQSIATLTANISTLTSQKSDLLNAMTEIDNSINDTEDETEIDNLDEKKQEILDQIDALNDIISELEGENTRLTRRQRVMETQISFLNATISDLKSQVATLEVDKAALETQIATLEKQIENSGVKYLYTQYCVANMQPRKSNEWLYAYDYVNNFTSNEVFKRSVVEAYCVNVSYNGNGSVTNINKTSGITPTWYHNGTEITSNEACELIGNMSTLVFQTKVFAEVDNDTLISFKIDIIDSVFSGKYVAKSGYYIDFDNKTTNLWLDVSISGFVINDSNCTYLTLYTDDGAFGDYDISDITDTSFIINGEIYTKVTEDAKEDTQSTNYNLTLDSGSYSFNYENLDLYKLTFLSNGQLAEGSCLMDAAAMTVHTLNTYYGREGNTLTVYDTDNNPFTLTIRDDCTIDFNGTSYSLDCEKTETIITDVDKINKFYVAGGKHCLGYDTSWYWQVTADDGTVTKSTIEFKSLDLGRGIITFKLAESGEELILQVNNYTADEGLTIINILIYNGVHMGV